MDYLKIVQELNHDIYEKHGIVEEQFYFMASGFIDVIGFGDVILWNSENDDRRWIEEKSDYEPMKPFVKNKLKKYGKLLCKLSS